MYKLIDKHGLFSLISAVALFCFVCLQAKKHGTKLIDESGLFSLISAIAFFCFVCN
jgi:hypothetical protein